MSALWSFSYTNTETSIDYCLVAWKNMFHISEFIGRMSELNIRYWLETDEFLFTTGKVTEKQAYCQLYFIISIHNRELLLQLYHHWIFYHKKYFV